VHALDDSDFEGERRAVVDGWASERGPARVVEYNALMPRSQILCALVAGLSGLVPSPGHAKPSAVDHSTPSARSGPSSVALESRRRELKIFQGHVKKMHRPKSLDGWTRIELDSSGAGLERSFRLLATRMDLLPFKAGDVIWAKIDCTRGGWHLVCDLVLRDAAKKLLLIISGSGDAALAPDWKIEPGRVLREQKRTGGERSVRRELGLSMSHAGRTALTDHRWRRLVTSDGVWLLTGSAVAWEGTRPPDAVNYTTYAIMRSR
jgi:hypothetical protein